MLRWGTTVMGVNDMDRAVTFWTQALPIAVRDAVADDFTVLVPTDGAGPGLALDRTDSPPPSEPHVHLDLYACDAADQAAEIERMLGLGASRVDWPHYRDGSDFVVLADTEGNRFCVIDTGRD